MLLAWCLVTYGITLVLTGSKIIEPLRRRFDLVFPKSHFAHCPMCIGWWVGFGLGLLLPRLGPLAPLELPRWEQALGEAFAASGVCWGIHVVLVKLGSEEL